MVPGPVSKPLMTLQQFLTEDLDPLGRQIIQAVLDDATVDDYEALTPLYI